MKFVTLDIETIPLQFDDRKIYDYLMDKNIDRHYHPLFSKIITIGIKSDDGKSEIFCGDDERKILTDFWGRLVELNPPLIVTWNGYGFDIPFINMRSIINDIRIKKHINTNKWKMVTSNHFDCMLSLSVEGNFAWVSLDIACRVFGIQIPKDRIGAGELYAHFQRGKWETIKIHNEQDLLLTEELFRKLRPHAFHGGP